MQTETCCLKEQCYEIIKSVNVPEGAQIEQKPFKEKHNFLLPSN